MKLTDVSPLIPAQDLADKLADQFKQPKTRIDPSDSFDRPTGGKATIRSSGWKDYPIAGN